MNSKTEKIKFFWHKTENQSKNILNRKTKNLNARILIEE